MRKLLLASSALVFAGSAYAADVRIPTKAPVPVAAPFSWNGCYVGAHGGYGWGQNRLSDPQLGIPDPLFGFPTFGIAPAGATLDIDTRGWLAGGQAGCNIQGGSWVLGFEVDAAWANIEGSIADPFFANKNGDPQLLGVETKALATATGRVGYAFDRFLVYGKGGAAWARNDYDAILFNQVAALFAVAPSIPFSASETRIGWTVGAGIEYAFWDRWSVKVEYNHYEFEDRRISLVSAGGAILPIDVDQSIDTVKVGVNYRLWSPL
jgi:outer membrane immunogenic protein